MELEFQTYKHIEKFETRFSNLKKVHQQRCSEKENVHHINGCHFKTYPFKHFMRLDLGLIIFRRITKLKKTRNQVKLLHEHYTEIEK